MFEKALCFCLPYMVRLGVAAGIFLTAYLLFWLFILAISRMEKGGLKFPVSNSIRKPLLCLFFEAAAFISLFVFELQEQVHRTAAAFVLVLVVLTVGWLCIRTIRRLFHHAIEIYKMDPHRRSSVIQIQFVYRLIVIAIVILTIGTLLLLFPSAKHLGVGVLGSAGIVGLVVGMAARPIFLNLMAGLQIALSKTINLDDAVIVEGDMCRIESIHLTYVIARTWDMRRHVVPISQFIDKPFQNLDLVSKEKLGTVFLYVDYRASLDALREKFKEVVESCPHFNGNVYKFHVVEMNEQNMQIRLLMTGEDVVTTFELRSYVREKMIDYLQKEQLYALPVMREIQKEEVA